MRQRQVISFSARSVGKVDAKRTDGGLCAGHGPHPPLRGTLPAWRRGIKSILFLALALSLSSCGVRGDPEPPPGFEQAR